MRYATTHCQCKPVEHGFNFTGPCFITGKPYTVFVPTQELLAYNQGKYIQEALTSVSPDDREFLISGMSPEGWKLTFRDE